MTAGSTFTTDQRQRYAIARDQERRAGELAPLRTEIARAIAEVGWRRARPVTESVLGPGVRVSGPGPRAAWWQKVGKRNGARLLAGLETLPVQARFALQPGPSVTRGREVPDE